MSDRLVQLRDEKTGLIWTACIASYRLHADGTVQDEPTWRWTKLDFFYEVPK